MSTTMSINLYCGVKTTFKRILISLESKNAQYENEAGHFGEFNDQSVKDTHTHTHTHTTRHLSA